MSVVAAGVSPIALALLTTMSRPPKCAAVRSIAALTALWGLYAPQIDDYVRRAVNPGAAPSFGVPGNP